MGEAPFAGWLIAPEVLPARFWQLNFARQGPELNGLGCKSSEAGETFRLHKSENSFKFWCVEKRTLSRRKSRADGSAKKSRRVLGLGALVLAIAVVAGVVWGMPAYDRFQLAEGYEQAIEADDLELAEAIVSEMVASHPQHEPFEALPDEIRVLISSKEGYQLATEFFDDELYPEALEQLSLVDEADTARSVPATDLEAEVIEAFERSLEQEVDELLRAGQRIDALLVVDDALNQLSGSSGYEQLRTETRGSVAQQTSAEVEGLIDEGRPIPATKLWAETAAAFGNEDTVFAQATAGVLERLELIQAEALDAMHVWEIPGPGGFVRLDDIASLDFTATEESFFFNTPSGFQLDASYSPNGDSFPSSLDMSVVSIYGPADLDAVYADVDGERIDLNMVDGSTIDSYDDGFIASNRAVTPDDLPNLLRIIEAEEATIVLQGPSGSTVIPLTKVDRDGLERTTLAYLAVSSDSDALW